ncbi:MAG: FKBP-type peptidyl-prolyl cis-trans isomerase [Thermoproteota archaeon]|nr:FKBP-type peptidyl-prolyl cis-trans isomerase [Thermoproteota archaeon]
MPLKKGDFILMDFTGKVKETGEVFDTTIEEVAKEKRLYKEGEIYEPQLVVIGEGWVLKALDENLADLEVGKKKSVEIPPEKAFGPHNPEKIKLVPLRRLTSRGITPTIGARIEYEGKTATVRTTGAGRVRLDFNPPLAGKTLIYEVTVKEKLETKQKKITALIHRRIPAVDATKFTLKTTKTMVKIGVPEEAFYLEGVQLAKRGIATDVQRFFPEINRVKFIETFKRRAAGGKQG